MILKPLFPATFAALALVASAFAGGEGWTHDFEAAKKQAAAEKKDLLLDFTGSEWCGICKMLDQEVFQQDAFKNGVKDKFVLVELDYPQEPGGKVTGQAEEVRLQNERLAAKYPVPGMPSVILCDASGRPYAQTGYQEGGAEKYVAHLDELRALGARRAAFLAEAAKAEGVPKAKALVGALRSVTMDPPLFDATQQDLVEAVLAADPQDETGFAKQQAQKKDLVKFEEELNGFGASQDIAGALAFVEKTAASDRFEGEAKQQVLATKAIILARMERFDDALKALDEAKSAAPESQIAPQLEAFKAELAQAKEQAASQAPPPPAAK
jgi:thioredoxin-related protein